ncbi:hypothetical protein E2C01_097219 [Portunus trituberculatus]|uniref:Uncharacterized protein n=1 Tax=Portunus trituberculatus TaxID=210409 RepID=A0A5B7K3Y0_PORTR|nr:hypothetical protein [Portunus trituberculatus]
MAPTASGCRGLREGAALCSSLTLVSQCFQASMSRPGPASPKRRGLVPASRLQLHLICHHEGHRTPWCRHVY